MTNNTLLKQSIRLRKNRLLHYFLSYFSIYLLCICIFSFVFFQLYNRLKQNVIEANVSAMKQTINTIDMRLNEINRLAKYVSKDQNLNLFATDAYVTDADFAYKKWKYPRVIKEFLSTNSLIQDGFIYFKRLDLIMNLKTTYSLKEFYNYSYQSNHYNFEQWKEKWFNNYQFGQYYGASNIRSEGVTFSAITYAVSFPFGSDNNFFDSTLILHISEDAIKKNISDSFRSYNENFFIILDSNDHYLTGSMDKSLAEQLLIQQNDLVFSKEDDFFIKNIHIDNNYFHVIQIRADISRWQYTIALPSDKLFSDIDILRNSFVFILFALFFLIATFAYILTLRDVKDYMYLAEALEQKSQHIDELLQKQSTIRNKEKNAEKEPLKTQQHTKSTQDTIFNVIAYIQENYSNPQLSLISIADYFNLSEKHLSTTFKSITNENISDFLETIRMRKAMELLEFTDMSIVMLSKEVGYISDVTFRRAFKRLLGITPTEYRKTHENKNN